MQAIAYFWVTLDNHFKILAYTYLFCRPDINVTETYNKRLNKTLVYKDSYLSLYVCTHQIKVKSCQNNWPIFMNYIFDSAYL